MAGRRLVSSTVARSRRKGTGRRTYGVLLAAVTLVGASCGAAQWTATSTLCAWRPRTVHTRTPILPEPTTTVPGLGLPTGPFELSSPFSRSVFATPAPDGWTVDVIFGLVRPARDLTATVRAVSDPCSPQFRRYRTAAEIARDSGATSSTRHRVTAFLRSFGIIPRVDATGSFVEAVMTLAQARRLFGVPIMQASYPSGSIYIAPRSPLTLPGALRGSVDLVLGVDATISLQTSRPIAPPAPSTGLHPPPLGGQPVACREMRHVRGLAPNELLTAYGLAPLRTAGNTGAGVSMAIGEEVAPNATDVHRFMQCLGQPDVHLVTQDLGGEAVSLSQSRFDSLRSEATADGEIVAGVAPRLRNLYVLVAHDGNFVENLAEQFSAVIDPKVVQAPPAVFSLSFEQCEPVAHVYMPRALTLVEHVLEADALAGVTVVAASGDAGSTCTAPAAGAHAHLSVGYPGASSYVTSVGGTRIALDEENHIASEQVWTSLPYGGHGAGGGGTSSTLLRPWYQADLANPSPYRLTPDVSFQALYYDVYVSSPDTPTPWTVFGGTSASAPLFGAGIALVDEALARVGRPPVGLVNPTLYALARGSSGALHDVTQGRNDAYDLGCCTATLGYDTASGLGSVDFTALTRLLS